MTRALRVPTGAIEGATQPAKRVSQDPLIAGIASNAVNASNYGNYGKAVVLKKLTIRLDEELLGRIRAAFLADLASGSGLTTISDWASHHLEAAVIASEEQTNGGKPRQPLDVGTVPRGPRG
ncbi:MAG: hypothetical protein QM705_11185 [Ancrocorticia sp.]